MKDEKKKKKTRISVFGPLKLNKIDFFFFFEENITNISLHNKLTTRAQKAINN